MKQLAPVIALTFALSTTAHAAGVGTLSLADLTAYAPRTTPTDTLTGSVIDIAAADLAAATGIPSEGVDVRLGSELKNQLDSVAAKSCDGKDNNRCFNDVKGLLVSQSNSIVARQLVLGSLLIEGVLLLVASVLIQSYVTRVKPDVQAQIHLPKVQVAQASSIHASSISTFALATGTAAPFVTVTVQPTLTYKPAPALVTPATVTTYAADLNGHKKNDIVISISEDQARRWQELIARTKTDRCVLADQASGIIQARQFKDTRLTTALCASAFLLGNMNPQGQFAGLINALPQRFNWQDEATNLAMGQVQGYARQHAADLGIDEPTAARYGVAAFAVARAVIIDGNTLVGDGNNAKPIVVAANAIDLAHPPAPGCLDYTTSIGLAGCRFQGAIEACTTRYTTTKTCLDSKPTPDKKKRLIVTTNIIPWTVTEADPYPEPTAASESKPDDDVKKVDQGDLRCNKFTDPGNADHFVGRDMMLKAANFFCDRQVKNRVYYQPDKVKDDAKKFELHYNDNFGDPVYVSMEWINNPGCPITDFARSDAKTMCTSRLANAIEGCDTSNVSGLYWWKQGGSFFRDCVTWTIRRDWGWVQSGYADLTYRKPDDRWRPSTHTCQRAEDCGDVLRCPVAVGNACVGSSESDLKWCQCDY